MFCNFTMFRGGTVPASGENVTNRLWGKRGGCGGARSRIFISFQYSATGVLQARHITTSQRCCVAIGNHFFRTLCMEREMNSDDAWAPPFGNDFYPRTWTKGADSKRVPVITRQISLVYVLTTLQPLLTIFKAVSRPIFPICPASCQQRLRGEMSKEAFLTWFRLENWRTEIS